MTNVKEILPTQSIYTELYRIQSFYKYNLLPDYILFIRSCAILDGVIKNYLGR